MTENLLRPNEAAAFLGVSPRTFRRMRGRLHGVLVLIPSPTGRKPIKRYDPAALRLFVRLYQDP